MKSISLRALLLFSALQVSFAFVLHQHSFIQKLSPPRQHSISQQHEHTPASFNKQHSSTMLSMITDTDSLLLAEQSLSLRNTDVWIFIAGLFPFAWATVEFWRRIAVGEPFGTGKDSVFIGKDNAPDESRGRRVLDRGAFLVAYLLFGIAAAAIGITLFSVITSPPMESL